MEDLAVAAIHVGHVNGVAICPIDFPVWAHVSEQVVTQLGKMYDKFYNDQ